MQRCAGIRRRSCLRTGKHWHGEEAMNHEAEQAKPIILRIRRQDTPDSEQRWEYFSVPRNPNMNITSCLQYIAAHPLTADGQKTTPVVYDSNCLEEVCGACTMLVNGRVRQACSALVDRLGHPSSGVGAAGEPITLEPMT